MRTLFICHTNVIRYLPKRPTDDDVSLHGHTQGAIYGARLSDQSECVNPRRDVWENAVVVAGKKRVLGVAVDGGKSERENKMI